MITGLQIRPQSYSQAVRGSKTDNNSEHERTIKKQVITFLHNKDVDIEKENIDACHTNQKPKNKVCYFTNNHSVY